MMLSTNAKTPIQMIDEIVALILARATQQKELANLTADKSRKKLYNFTYDELMLLAREISAINIEP